MVRPRTIVNKNVGRSSKNRMRNRGKRLIHEGLKSGEGVTEAKWPNTELKVSDHPVVFSRSISAIGTEQRSFLEK